MKMKVYEKLAKKTVNINEKNDYLATGGEGTLYVVNNRVYKITHHPFVEAKLLELMKLQHPNIVVPVDFILDQKNAEIGYVLPFADGESICRLFATAFWADNKLGVPEISGIIENAVSTVQYAHDQDSLLVDWNEMNFLVDKQFKHMIFIDTNAWKTKSFPPNAITPIFQDHLTKGFNTLSDWYGFGILACKLYVGIHPFKGSHPNYGRTQDDVVKRMKDNVSIFNPNSKVPAAARTFDHIPDAYMQWFLDIFEKGVRREPPNVAGYVTVVKKQVTSAYKYFQVDLFKMMNQEVKRYYVVNGEEVVFCENEIVVGMKNIPLKNNKVKIGVIVSKREKVPYFVFISKGKLIIYNADGTPIDLDLVADDFLVQDHVIYVKNRGSVVQISCNDLGDKQVFSIGDQWSVMPNSTKTLGNCFYMSVMGKTHMIVPWVLGNKYYLRTIAIPELDGYKVVEAKFDQPVLGIVGEQNGKYDRFMLTIDPMDGKYHVEVEPDIGMPVLNFVVLDNGIGVSMDEDGQVNMFTTNINKLQSKSIKDDTIKSTMRLFKNGVTVLFAEGSKIYSLKVAKTA
jgi:serine/threonine protein kinase